MPSVIAAGTTSNTALNFTADTTGVLQLQTNGTTAAVTINTSQNVGIGTTSPRSKLDVNGSIYTEWSDTNFIGMQFGSDTSSYRMGMLPISSTRDLQIYSKSGDSFGVSGITFYTGTGPTERMRITSGGNVFIGTTSSLTGSLLEVNSGSAASSIGFGGNSNGAYPTSNFGGAISYNFSAGGAEFDIWNTYVGSAYSFDFYQKTGASAASRVLRINPNGTLNLLGANVTSGVGIAFPATQSASSDANTLDDYEEGTWTPAVTATGGGLTISYSSRSGRYTKIGRVVYCEFDLTISSESGGSGDLYIGNLPFTKSSDAPAFSGDMATIRGGRTTALGGVSATRIAWAFAGTVLGGSTNLELGYTDSTSGAANTYTVSDLTTGRIVGSFQYCV